MKTYFLSLIGASLCVALISILAPNGTLGKYVRLLTSLFLICVIISPLDGAIDGMRELINGTLTFPDSNQQIEEEAREEWQSMLDSSSKTYFLQSLRQLLEAEFSISPGEIDCSALWEEKNGAVKPRRIHILLSGSAIWKDPKAIEHFIGDLLGCECIIAVA